MAVVERFSEEWLRARLVQGDMVDRSIPAYMFDTIVGYIRKGRPVDPFTEAVLRGDLFEAVARADGRNVEVLPAWVFFFFNYAPKDCWGSAEAVKAWKGLDDGSSED